MRGLPPMLFVAFKAILGPLSDPLDKDIVFSGFNWQHTHREHRRDTKERQVNLPRKIRGITPRRGNNYMNKHLVPFPLDMPSNTPVPYKTWHPLLYLSLSIDRVPLCDCFSKVRFLNMKSMDRASEF